MSDGPKSHLQELISHQEAAFYLALFAEILGIEIPTDPRRKDMFLENLKNAAKTCRKKVKALELLMDAHLILHGGRR